MSDYSLDIETLGVNVNDTILSIGICEFNIKTGDIIRHLEVTFDIPDNASVSCNIDTLRFWIQQSRDNPKAVLHVFYNKNRVRMREGLGKIIDFLAGDSDVKIWANGTKFDLSMVERLFKVNHLPVPWAHNADCCMRTLRRVCGKFEVDVKGYIDIEHTALGDAIWQAKYISACMQKITVKPS